MSDSNFSQDFAFLAAKHAALQQRKLRSKTFSVVDFAECTKPVFALLQPYLVGRVRGNFPSANWGFRNDDAFATTYGNSVGRFQIDIVNPYVEMRINYFARDSVFWLSVQTPPPSGHGGWHVHAEYSLGQNPEGNNSLMKSGEFFSPEDIAAYIAEVLYKETHRVILVEAKL